MRPSTVFTVVCTRSALVTVAESGTTTTGRGVLVAQLTNAIASTQALRERKSNGFIQLMGERLEEIALQATELADAIPVFLFHRSDGETIATAQDQQVCQLCVCAQSVECDVGFKVSLPFHIHH